MDMHASRALVQSDEVGPVDIPVGSEPPLTVAVQTFVDMIVSPRDDYSSLALGVKVIETLGRAQESLENVG